MDLVLLTKDQLPDNALTISHSRMMTWNRCSYKYWLSYESQHERVQRFNRPMLIGTIGHKCLQYFYNLSLNQPVEELSPQQYDNICSDIKDEFDHDMMGHECCLKALGIFYKYQQWAGRHDNWIPILTEVETYVYLGKFKGRPVYFHVIIDLLVEEEGALGVVDHKWTGQFWKDDQVYFDTQLPFYMNMLRKAGATAEFGVINGISTYSYKTSQPASKLFDRKYVHHSETRLTLYHEEIMKSVKQMLTAEEYPRALQKDCAYCGFNEICNAHLRGLPIQDLISNLSTVDDNTLDIEVDV